MLAERVERTTFGHPEKPKHRNGFTEEQRIAILQRDEYKCQAPFKHNCGGNLTVHHIMLVGYAIHLGIDPNFATNGLTLCHHAHDVIHPDVPVARKQWQPRSDVFMRLFERRMEALNDRKIYWNDKFDRAMSAVAVRNTQLKEREGWEFPE